MPALRMSSVAIAGRCLFALIFVVSGLNHLLASRELVALASARGVPAPRLAVLGSGALILAGGLSVALGYHARTGAWLLVLFLVPTTLVMHPFWGIADDVVARNQMLQFMKNVSMLGGALMIAHFGSGPGSLDGRA
ncbi:MAG: DoxX family protein [Candidatus Binatia bacterium]